MKLKINILLFLMGIMSMAHAQNSASRASSALRKQLNECKQNNLQLSTENNNLKFSQRQLTNTMSNLQDSLKGRTTQIVNLKNDILRVNEQGKILSNNVTSTNNLLSESQEKLKKANYEIEILQNPQIVRVYDMDLPTLKQALVSRLLESSLGFQFDEDASKNQYKITKAFDADTENWWVFDKTIDVMLEMNMRMEPHQFDKNKTLVFNSTTLLQKERFSNKQFALQTDHDKEKLYQEKAIRILEANIRKDMNK